LTYKNEPTTLDLIYTFYTPQFVLNVILTPLACLVGFLLNLRIVRTIHRNRGKELKDDLYAYMSLNAKCNCAYSLIFVFGLMSECILPGSDLLCSSVRTSLFVQYFKIVVVEYVGGVLKVCANFSYVLMTLNRHMLIGKERFWLFEKLAGLKMKSLCLSVLLFGSVLGLVKLNEYKINVLHDEYNYPFLRDSTPSENFTQSSSNVLQTVCAVCMIIYDSCNYLLSSVFNSIVEISIVVKLRRELKKKEQAMTNLAEDIRHRKLEENERTRRKALTMIVVNGLLNLILRMPELAALVYFAALVPLIVHMSNLFFISTFTSNYIIFYVFNNQFRKTLQSKKESK
jgi:hypothetical protein